MRWNMDAALRAHGIYVDGSMPNMTCREEHAYAFGTVAEKAAGGLRILMQDYGEVLEDIVDFERAFTFVFRSRLQYPALMDDILEGYVDA